MDTKILLCFILLSCFSEAIPYKKTNSDTYFASSYEDEYEDLPLEEVDNKNPAPRKPHTYEVYENVIDIPDDRYTGPIHANFTIHRPLNIAPIVITENGNLDEGKKNCISFLDVKNDEKHKVSPEVLDLDKIPESHGLKDYLNGLKKGIVSGFKSIIHRNKHVENFGPEDTGPLSFLDKFHKKVQI